METKNRLQLSDPQRAALEFNTSTMVHAVAGSGKTTILIELFTRLLLGTGAEGVALRPHELAAITFTNAAAGEMQERLRARLKELADEARAAGTDERPIRETLARLHQVRISTIHGLCRRLIAAHPLESGYDPMSRIQDEREAARLRGRCMASAIHDTLGRLDPHTLRWLQRTGLVAAGPRGDSAVGWLSSILEKMRQAGIEPEECRSLFANDPVPEQNWVEHTRRLANAASRLIPQLRGAKGKEAPALLAALNDWEPRFQTLADKGDWITLGTWLETLRGFCTTSDGKTPYKRLPDQEGVGAVIESTAILASLCWERVARPTLIQTYDWLAAAARAMEEWKQANAAWEQQDHILLARRLLREHPAIQREWRDQLKTLFVDEFQDTDPVQIELIARLSGLKEDGQGPRRKLFLVGDPRQAIYGFRGADFQSYLDFREGWEKEAESQRLLDFPHIRRSHPALVRFFNAMMDHAYARTGLDRRQQDTRPMEAARQDKVDRPRAVWLRPGEGEEAWSNREWEAAAIAQEVRRVLDSGIEPGEVAVLMRKRKHLAIYEQAMARAGIPYAVYKGSGYHSGCEIADALNAWSVFLRPGDALALASLLRSPMAGLDDPSLFALGQLGIEGSKTGPLHNDRWTDPAVRQRMLEACTPVSRNALERFFGWAMPLWEDRNALTLAGLMERVLEATDYLAFLLADPQGPQRVANLKKLIESARAFERSGRLSAEWPDELEERIAAPPEDTQAPLHEPKGGSVNLLTIHGAKGLEWKAVFLAGLDTTGGGPNPPHWDYVKEKGVGVAALDESGETHATWTLDAIRALQRQREREESVRLLYVGITRAADWLFLSGSPPKRKSGSEQDSWYRHVESLAQLDGAGELIETRIIEVPGITKAVDTAQGGTLTDHIRARPADASAEAPPAALDRDFDEPPAREVTVAVTALADRLFCARYAAWKRLGDEAMPVHGEEATTRVPEIEAAVLGATESGRLIHAMLDAADLDAKPEQRRDRMIARALSQQGIAEERLTAPERQRVEDLARRAERWIEAASAQWRSHGVRPQREWPFLIRVDNPDKPVLVRGVIDLWTEGPDGPHHLIDFKLAKPKEPGATLYAFQLGVYAWALERITGSRPRDVRLEHLVEPPQSVTVDVSETVTFLASGDFIPSLAKEREINGDADVLALEGHAGDWCAVKKCPHLARCHGISPPA